ncbi:MAG TPA: ATPase [Elusimicrobia bacterium]|jgi:hypothetical protein|nr:ATPase [Elusimicrobiota bacterium]
MVKRTFWLKVIENLFRKRNIIWLHGVRRVGKTFLCRSIAGVKYFDCELPSVRREVEDAAFLDNYKNSLIALDEIHRLKNPSEILKIAADYYPKTKIIATGSSTFQSSRRFRDTLAGRKYDLWLTPMIHQDLIDFKISNLKSRFHRGGLPPFLLSKEYSEKDFSEWLDSFWAKDIQELFHLEKRYSFLKFIELLLGNSGGIFEATHYAQLCEVSRPTIMSYRTILELTTLITVIRPFARNKTREIVAAPKIYGFDTGFISFIKGWDTLRPDDYGYLWEHLVLNELKGGFQTKKIYYWRDKFGHEVDFVILKNPDSPTTIECKWRSEHFDPRNLQIFRKVYPRGKNFLIVQDCQKPYSLTFGKLKVEVIGLADLFNQIG